MKLFKEYIFFLTGMFGCFITGMWVSSQQVAKMLDYPIEFHPIFILANIPIYAPEYVLWWINYGDIAPYEFESTMWPTFVGLMGSVIFVLSFAFARVNNKKSEDVATHGTAHFATPDEIQKSGLLDNKGLILGITIPEITKLQRVLISLKICRKPNGFYLRDNGPSHVFLSAPPRSGKGVGPIISSLLVWEESALILDIKKENYEATAGFRSKVLNHTILKFEPTDAEGTSARFNPLHEVRVRTAYEISDLQNLIQLFMNPDGSKSKNSSDSSKFFETAAAELLTAAILHALYTDPKASLPRVAMFLSKTEMTIQASDDEEEEEDDGVWEFLKEMVETEHADVSLFRQIYGDVYDDITGNHPIIGKIGRDFLGMPARTRADVLKTANNKLILFVDPIIAKNMSESDFSISDLMNHEKPVSLYLVTPPGKFLTIIPLFRLIINFVVQKLAVEMKFEDGKHKKMYKHRLLMVLDEFPQLGYFEAIEKLFGLVPGYGIKALIVAQSTNQIYKEYGKNTSIMDNCNIRIAYTPNDIETASWISRLLGKKTEITENKSYQRGFTGAMGNTVTISTSETSRALAFEDEILTFPLDQEIIMTTGNRPIIAKKIVYFKDKKLNKRWLPAPPSERIFQNRPIIIDAKRIKPAPPQKSADEDLDNSMEDFYGSSAEADYDYEA